MLLGLRGAALAAVSGALCYAVLVGCLLQGFVGPPPDQAVELYRLSQSEAIYYMVVNLLMLVVVTSLAGYLAERLRIFGGRLERAEERAARAERMAALGQLAAGLAHEIRNPLGGIAGSIQLLRDSSALTAEDRELCEIIKREAERLNDLVTDMMDLTRRRAPMLEDVDAADVAREVVNLASKSGRGASDVRVVYAGDEEARVRADAAQLRQLIWNLVKNAVQASGAGDEVKVSVTAAKAAAPELVVADEGVGIDDVDSERLFDAFFTTRSQGTGVGLAVVKAIADAHGFEVDVSSEKGRGATFRVRLGPSARV
jgi:signal transduction histidine kinase